MRQLPPSAHRGPLLSNVDGALIYLQRQKDAAANSSKVETLVVDLVKGKCSLVQAKPLEKDAALVYGVLGMLRLHGGAVLVLVTEVKQVATIAGSAVYKVKDTKLYTHAAVQKHPADLRLSSLLKHAMDCQSLGSHMYLSNSLDLTNSSQRQAAKRRQYAAAASPQAAWKLLDRQFVWNAHLAQPLLDAGAAHFVAPIIAGYVVQLQSIPLPAPCQQQLQQQESRTARCGSGVPGSREMQPLDQARHPSMQQQQQQQLGGVCVLSRRCNRRASAGVWRRGADAQGNAAAFTKTEQLLTLGAEHHVAAAHLQTSGSVPLLWWQVPDLRPRPAILLNPSLSRQAAAFDAHVAALQARYGAVLSVDLLQQRGLEAALQAEFVRNAGRLAARLETHHGPSSSKGQDIGSSSSSSSSSSSANTRELRDSSSKGSEGVETKQSGKVGTECASTSGSSGGSFGVISFDYASVCGRLRHGRLAGLEEQLTSAMSQQGLFVASPRQAAASTEAPKQQEGGQQQQQQQEGQQQQQQQRGVLRLHSLECADRVNVVRGLVGQVALARQLAALGLMQQGSRLEDANPQLAANLALLWCAHGEALSLQHAGSESMLADLVKHGHPTLTGWVDDVAMRASRWYGDCFAAYKHQDALDVLHGKHAAPASNTNKSASSGRHREGQQQQQQQQPRQPTRTFALILAAVLALLAVAQLPGGGIRGLLAGGWQAAASLLAPLAAAAAVLAQVLRDPDAYVCWPKVCAQELPRPQPWHRRGSARHAVASRAEGADVALLGSSSAHTSKKEQ